MADHIARMMAMEAQETAGGKADLVGGKVPASQLPSYVDDVANGYMYEGKFYADQSHTTEITGEEGKIYLDLSTNTTYRWDSDASVFIPITGQSDWNQTDTNAPDFINNKPTLGTAAAKDMDSALSESSTNPVENKAVAHEINVLRMAIGGVLLGLRIDKQNDDPDTRVELLYDALGVTPAFMDFSTGAFNYGGFGDLWFVKNNRPVALTFAGEVDYELSHTDFTKRFDGVTASDVDDAGYGGNFMAEMPCVYVKRWEDARYNYIAFSDKKLNEEFLAQAHTNASGVINDVIYLPMFKGWKDTNGKLRSLMGTYPTGSTTAQQEVDAAALCGSGWQIWDKAKIDLIMDLIVLITKSTDCKAKIGVGDVSTYNSSDTTNYGKMRSGYETDGTTRAVDAQFYGSEGNDASSGTYGKHHCSAFFVQDHWGNRWDRILGFNLVNDVYKVKMTPPFALDSDSTYQTPSVSPPGEGWLKNVSSGKYGEVPTAVGASKSTGFASYFYKNASGSRLALFGGFCSSGMACGRYWYMNYAPSNNDWSVGGSPCFNHP